MSLFKAFRIDFLLTALALAAAFFYAGLPAVPLTLILIVIEFVFSFDNAAVNAKYLGKLNRTWRVVFLTAGMVIAVLGMRLAFPFLIVGITARLGPVQAWTLALEHGDPSQPGTYGYILNQAHPQIVGFGSMFLLMLFLGFLFDTDRETTWLSWIEKPLLKAGRVDAMPTVVSLAVLLLAVQLLVEGEERLTVLVAGVCGLLLFLVVDGFSGVMEAQQEKREAQLENSSASGGSSLLSGKAALSVFVFLEVLDASFSFDGVLGAFAITADPIIIALGLGIGALYVRSMTIYLVDQGTLSEYEYLEHGAHWAIGALAVTLLVSLAVDVPELVSGLIGVVLIGAAVLSSVVRRRRESGDRDTTQDGAAAH